MEYRYLGSSGLQVSALSFGSWVTFGKQIDTDVTFDCMTAAYEAGVNFFDNAEGIPQETRASLPDHQWLREDFEREEAWRNLEKVKRIQPIAEELGCTMAQLALAWCLKKSYVSTVITGAPRPKQAHENNMKALEIVARLTDPVIERIESILENDPIQNRILGNSGFERTIKIVGVVTGDLYE